MSVWGSAFLKAWQRSEMRLAYAFDSYKHEEREPQREEFRGQFVIDQVSNKIIKKTSFSSFYKRRLVSWLPSFNVLDGFCLIFATFWIFTDF